MTAATTSLVLTSTTITVTATQGDRVAHVVLGRLDGVTVEKGGPVDLQDLCYDRIEVQVNQDLDTRIGS
jgi:hypothetical protein